MRALMKYFKSFVLSMQNTMEYRFDFFMRLVSIILPVVTQYFLWTAIFQSSHSSTVYDYTYAQIISYAIIAGLVSRIVSTGFENEISTDIKDGGLSKFLIKPIGYFNYRISCFLGQKVLESGILVVLIFALLFVLKILLGLNVEFFRIGAFLLALVLAIVLNFLIAYGISAIAFWMTEISYLFNMVRMVINIVSGGLLPLEVFGPGFGGVFNFLPFKYVIYFPINIINGKLAPYDVLYGIFAQCIWVCVTLLLSKLLWWIGLKKYVAVGG